MKNDANNYTNNASHTTTIDVCNKITPHLFNDDLNISSSVNENLSDLKKDADADNINTQFHTIDTDKLKENSKNFTLKYYSDRCLPRKKGSQIQRNIERFITQPIGSEIQKILRHLKNGNLELTEKSLREIIVFLIPYFLYFDDFEVNNPLGSHTSSILGVYYSFPSAPNFLKYKLNNIFIAALYKSIDVKTFGNSKSFYKLIDILNDLENNGIDLEIKSEKRKIFFSLGLVVGDNLALNSILGFSRSFSAKHFCRYCKLSKASTQNMCDEDFNQLRNISNYEQDVKSMNVEKTGIRENSIFNRISNYHVVDNFYADLLHDILEGVFQYDMCHIIKSLIKDKVIDLEILNIRKNSFQYGETEIGNISPAINERNLRHMSLKMSGREILTFVHFFPLMVGDLVDSNSNLWQFVVNLVEMLDILLMPTFSTLDLANLHSHIEYHNRTYVTLFLDTLKPKHHFLTHYIRIIQNSGPLKYLWTFNFESKHRELKSYVKNIMSRKNILISLAIKFGIVFSDFVSNFMYNVIKLPDSTYTACNSLYYKDLCNRLSLEELNSSVLFSRFERYGTTYKKDFVVFSYDPTFKAFVIKEMFMLNTKVFLLCKQLNVISYDKHYLSYVVEKHSSSEVTIHSIDNVKSPPIHVINLNGKQFLRPKPLFHD
ncbi:uncharacterized protein LOC142233175 [Haematobia irritans]|uniref:uncharacterized protein LOC142230963 n=1 Tax=Haematobia irritans TaxID=7368 RepID=UPI003F4FDFA1